jgi:hypothetical protein
MSKRVPTPSDVLEHLEKLPGISRGCTLFVTSTPGNALLPMLRKLGDVEVVHSYTLLVIRNKRR